MNSPIGSHGSLIRLDADEVFDYIVYPALIERNIEPIGSDRLKMPGRLSEQMWRLILECDLCIGVLTDENPNVPEKCFKLELEKFGRWWPCITN